MNPPTPPTPPRTTEQPGAVILDVCCGSRMMWFNKKDGRALYSDRRNEDYVVPPDKAYPNGTVISVRPDIVADFTALPFPDESFWHVVFDPPHVIRGAYGDM